MNTPSRPLDVTREEDWLPWAPHWQIREDTLYLNHGSFGPPPRSVRDRRLEWIARLDEQPMDFYVRQLEPALLEAREVAARFFGTSAQNLTFVENATYGMNVVAQSFPLQPGDEVLLNNHEYGAVHRIWERACQSSGARVVSARLPDRIESTTQVIDALLSSVTNRTRLVVLSHITSPTALILPVLEICEALQQRQIAVCIDGPHAPAQVDLQLDALNCGFYTASCHKWLCAPLGSGFLYVHPRWQDSIQPPIKSWGRLLPALPETWDEEFLWMGTRDPSPFLSIPKAIEFLSEVGLDAFRARTRYLAGKAERMLCDLMGTEPIASRDQGWYGSMAHVPLPPGDWSSLQGELWASRGIEIPIIHFEQRWFVRVSCHLYNHPGHLDCLTQALAELCQLA